MKKLFFTIVCSAFTLSSCAIVNNTVVKQGYDFSVIKSVRVGQFSSASDKKYGDVSGAVQGAFIRQFLAKGYDVVSDVNVEVDAVIEGSITKFRREKDACVKVRSRVYANTPFLRYDSDVYYDPDSYSYCKNSDGYSRDKNNVALIYNMKEEAAIGISAYMTDLKTGQIVWSNSCSEEDKDIDSAVNKVVRYVLKTLPKQ